VPSSPVTNPPPPISKAKKAAKDLPKTEPVRYLP
jgi:hypothetical protein